jgi:hypothetical protein
MKKGIALMVLAITLVQFNSYAIFGRKCVSVCCPVQQQVCLEEAPCEQYVEPCAEQYVEPCAEQYVEPCAEQYVEPCAEQYVEPCCEQVEQSCS